MAAVPSGNMRWLVLASAHCQPVARCAAEASPQEWEFVPSRGECQV
eukprot:CAMPEP_0168454772 /NCGR_PEP_ID=MMETSP0228-20121227/50393_1 /TAXON_ID=133427 /ORGANISM="Protoceratium reticulatum, Strain CCCM 535 (=CCMP 1889)" /LENGTH=45 /DNA_ID= /DNA_START= /DNA_END= /DNA_ORIENTATION=